MTWLAFMALAIAGEWRGIVGEAQHSLGRVARGVAWRVALWL